MGSVPSQLLLLHLELWEAEGDWEGTGDIPEAVSLGKWTWALLGWWRSFQAEGQRGINGKTKPSLPLLMQLPSLEMPTFRR